MSHRKGVACKVQGIFGLSFGTLLLLSLTALPLRGEEIVSTYSVPENGSGLAWDGRLIWMGMVGDQGSLLLGFDPERGEFTDTLQAPLPDCFGLTYYQGRLVYISSHSDSTYLIAHGEPVRRFRNPYTQMMGLGCDGQTLWSGSYYDPRRTLVQMDDIGQVLHSMPFSGNHCHDLAYHNGLIYAADLLTQEVRVVNPQTGRLANVFPSPGSNPSGLTSDGEFLWLLDDGGKDDGDLLYKMTVHQGGGGIRFSYLYHNYGSVAVGSNRTWTVWIYNDSDRDAELIQLQARDGNDEIFIPHMWDPPDIIEPGDSAGLSVTFQPAYRDSEHIYFDITYDIDRVTNSVYVCGKGVRAGREIDILNPRDSINFDLTRCGEGVRASNLEYLLLENNGGEPLTVGELRFGSPFFFTGLYRFPHTFDEPGLYPIPVFFRPDREMSYSDTVTVCSNDAERPEIPVRLTGRGSPDACYPAGRVLWTTELGAGEEEHYRIRAFSRIGDITGDEIGDVVVATNDYLIQAFHGASSFSVTPVWRYNTSQNPWRSGRVIGIRGLSEGGDWDGDGANDVVFGLDGSALRVVALSGLSGRELWIFDTHPLPGGGGEIRVARGEFDLNGDGVRDVFAVAAGRSEEHATKAIFMLNGPDGALEWIRYLDSPPMDVVSVPDITGDRIPDLFVLCEDHAVYALDGNRGREIWTGAVDGDIRSMFILDDVNSDGSHDLVFVANTHGIWMINGSNGMEIWHLPPHEPLWDVFNLTAGAPLNDVNGNGSPDFVVADAERWAFGIDGLTAEFAWYEPVLIGSGTKSMAPLDDLNGDGKRDFLVGTIDGRVFAISGDGDFGLWSYSSPGEGHGIEIVLGIEDIDGNNEMDALAAMAYGAVFCFAGTHVGGAGITPELDPQLIPAAILVDPAYPNPFNSRVYIPIRLSRPGAVTLSVFDLTGREVHRFSNGVLEAGAHRLFWDGGWQGGPVPSGFYLLRLESGAVRVCRSVNLVR